MTDLLPPLWVKKRDGRQEPFMADKISQALFAASRNLEPSEGAADAFLARELADGVVHFLASECEGTIPSTADIEEIVVKVVRELGHPALAAAFEEGARQRRDLAASVAECQPEATQPSLAPVDEVELTIRYPAGAPLAEALASCARAYSLATVFSSDLVAVRGTGLLVLGGLENPDRLAGCVVSGPGIAGGRHLLGRLAEAASLAGEFVALDGLEHWLARTDMSIPEVVRTLSLGLDLPHMRGVINLNSADPPSWADERPEGPLFPAPEPSGADQDRTRLADLADALLEGLLPLNHSLSDPRQLRIDWHLSEADFTPGGRQRLLRVIRRALIRDRTGVSRWVLGFVFDRPDQPVALAEGLTRQNAGVLMQVGLHLPSLADRASDQENFLHRLGSLARLALSAGIQKREHLRKWERAATRSDSAIESPGLSSGFLLDRARLMVTPLGLGAVISRFVGRELETGGAALDLARRVLLRLKEVLRQDGRTALLDTCLDGPVNLPVGGTFHPSTAPEKQWKIGHLLHSVTEHGTLALSIPDPQADQVADWLHTIWQSTRIVRVQIVGV